MQLSDFRLVAFLSSLIFYSIYGIACNEAQAQNSSEETTITRGVGFRQSNKFEFKYKERIKTYEEQIEMGLKRGWLSKEDANTFSIRLAKLKELESSVSANGYPKPELDNLELEITKFNKEFSDAGQKTKSPPTPKQEPESTVEASSSTKAPKKASENKISEKKTNKQKNKQKQTTKK